ncbi:hypothetical protein B0H19DRAFT_1149562 [Mycena capillaripes]|nr:hypothetical protein B0H19DRAFT_1149562 [Mycena capillaripes]
MLPSVGFLFCLTLALFLCNGSSIHVRARLVSRPKRSANVQRETTSDGGLSSASWIWAANSNASTTGNVAFLKNIPTSTGKIASSAIISMTAVGNFTLFVNGGPIGASRDVQDGWKSALTLEAALNGSANAFSVLVANSGRASDPPPGLLAAIQILYTDLTSSTFVSDASWLATRDIPSDFPTPTDLSHFPSAAVAAPNGSGPWAESVFPPSADPSPLTLDDSLWIWSTANASKGADLGTVGFRRTFPTPPGKVAKSATILLTVDDGFTLYLNGEYLGSPPGATPFHWHFAQRFTVDLNATENEFSVIGQNIQFGTSPRSPAGFIGAIEVLYDDKSSDVIRTDASWLNSKSVTLPILFLSAPADNLAPSIVLGPLGIAPWFQLNGTADVLSAARVPGAPFINSGTPASPPPTPHSVPVGAIVGAVVGAVGVLGLFVTLLIRRHRRQNARAAYTEAKGFDVDGSASECSTTAPSMRTTADPFNLESNSSARPPPAAAPPPRKLGIAAVMRVNGNLEAPPPSYEAEQSSRSVAAVNGDHDFTRHQGKVRQ